MDNYSFIGWTPCVSGHLDFGLARVGIRGGFTNKEYKDDRVVSKNLSLSKAPDSHHRAIVLQSKVDWRDTDNGEPCSGQFRVFLAAEAVECKDMDGRELVGNILIYHLNAEPEEAHEIKALGVHCLAHGVCQENVGSKFFEFMELIASSKNVLGLKDDCVVASLKFKVRPNGLTYLVHNDGDHEIDERSRFIIARQAFYYIKYSLHSHRHHVNEQDSLTTISTLDHGVGLRLICQLKRELTNLSRTQKIDNKISQESNAAGIISYAKSLIIGLSSDGLLSDDLAQKELKRFDNIQLSFASLEGRIDGQVNILERHKAKAKVWLGFLLIFAWSFINFYFSSGEKSEMPQHFSKSLPVIILLGAFLIYLAIVRYYVLLGDAARLETIYGMAGKEVSKKVMAAVGLIIFLVVVLVLDHRSAI